MRMKLRHFIMAKLTLPAFLVVAAAACKPNTRVPSRTNIDAQTKPSKKAQKLAIKTEASAPHDTFDTCGGCRWDLNTGCYIPSEVARMVEPCPARCCPQTAAKGPDTDHDGIADPYDLCPKQPEDHKHMIEGCPENRLPPNCMVDGAMKIDGDRDGIPDCIDLCPEEALEDGAILRGCPVSPTKRWGLH